MTCRHLPRTCRIYLPDGSFQCTRCGLTIGEQRIRRGRNSRQRGNAFQRDICKRLGLRNVGSLGTAVDAESDAVVVQVKAIRGYPERLDRWLGELPSDGRLRLVIVGDAPGPGNRRRVGVWMSFDDYWEWYGGKAA